MTGGIKPMGLFVTGTDTGVGKTHVTCLIARQLMNCGVRVAIYKPVCSGAVNESIADNYPDPALKHHWDDIDRIKAVIGDRWPDDVICPQRFLAPLAPPIAARLEGRTVDFQKLVDGVHRFQDQEFILVEGAGGWLAPVTDTQTVADVAHALKFPVLIVARAGLGTINHTLLTVASVRSRRVPVAGIVLNETSAVIDASHSTNGQEIESRSGAPVFGIVPFRNADEIFHQEQIVRINWRSLADS